MQNTQSTGFTVGQTVHVDFSEEATVCEEYVGPATFVRLAQKGEGLDEFLDSEPHVIVKISPSDPVIRGRHSRSTAFRFVARPLTEPQRTRGAVSINLAT